MEGGQQGGPDWMPEGQLRANAIVQVAIMTVKEMGIIYTKSSGQDT